jgi:hypothetical protein
MELLARAKAPLFACNYRVSINYQTILYQLQFVQVQLQ